MWRKQARRSGQASTASPPSSSPSRDSLSWNGRGSSGGRLRFLCEVSARTANEVKFFWPFVERCSMDDRCLESGGSMNFVALKMLTGDRAKYLGLIFAIAFSSFLIAHQSSIFAGIMDRTRSQIKDITDADIWVMDRNTQYFDEVNALTENYLYRVRGFSGVQCALPLFKGNPRAKAPDGKFRVVILLGLDDATLVGAPRKMVLGSADDLREPDAAIIDEAGYRFFFPKQPLELGRTLEMNDHRVRLVGICDAFAPFTTLPVVYTLYSQAPGYVGRERNLLSFVLVKPEPNVPIGELAKHITQATGLKAMSGDQFGWATIMYFVRNTGIPINFGKIGRASCRERV